MVKKFLSVFAVASTMLATSCSNEEFGNSLNGNEADVTFTAQLPEGLQSRSFGDGTTANTLSYAVYLKQQNDNWALTTAGKNDEAINMSKTVSLRLVNGNTYQVVFWADAYNETSETSPVYKFNTSDRKVEVNYNNITSNEEKLDAFFAVEEITVNGASSKNVELKRPFAQLNIGTSDLAAATTAGTTVTKAGIKVKAYQTLNFDGTVEGLSESEVTFDLADLPTGETFPVAGNKYLTMNYLLMPVDKETYNVTVFYDNAQVPERTFKNVPLQRNYRTNIYGNLLTSNEDLNVEINPVFGGENNISTSDGSVSGNLETDTEGRYHIKSAADFAYLMSTTQKANPAYLGKTIILDTDIDFAGQTITGVGSEVCNFAGNFDGNGHTISNFVIDQNNRNFYGGLFNQMTTANSSVKNLKVKGATVIAQKMAGIIASSVESSATVENCHVENCIVVATLKKAGAITGYTAGGTVKNCTAKNSFVYCADQTVAESDDIVGYINTGSTVSDNTATDVTVVRGTVPALISTAEEFAALTNENVEIHFVKDITMNNSFATKQFSNKDINVYGHGHTISNLPKPLFNFYGGTIKVADLNVTNSTIGANSDVLGCGAIAEQAQWCNLTMTNCNVSKTKIESNVNTRYGLLVGYLIGGGTITNCSVTNCEVKVSSGAVGGIVGHEARQSGYTNSLSISDCTVSGTKLETSDSNDWRVGEIIGTVVGTATSINNCKTSGNTLKQTNKTAPEGQSSLYGRISDGNITIN